MNYRQRDDHHHLKPIKNKKVNKKKSEVFRFQWLKVFKFLKEYNKPDKSQATCMACINRFSAQYSGKNNVFQHSKSKQHLQKY